MRKGRHVASSFVTNCKDCDCSMTSQDYFPPGPDVIVFRCENEKCQSYGVPIEVTHVDAGVTH